MKYEINKIPTHLTRKPSSYHQDLLQKYTSSEQSFVDQDGLLQMILNSPTSVPQLSTGTTSTTSSTTNTQVWIYGTNGVPTKYYTVYL